MKKFEWYRKWRGGEWHYNRYIFDMGRGMLLIWERKFLGNQGGSRTTLKSEKYD